MIDFRATRSGVLWKMSLYRFGFKRISIDNSSGSSTESQTIDVPDCMPSLDEARGLGLGEVEYKSVLNNASDVVMNSCKRQRIARGKYTKYSNEDRAKIGKYALENGNERARQHFMIKYPLLTESTVRNFKRAYKEKLQKESKKMNPQPVTSITPQPRGRPPILLEVDAKLIQLLRAIRAKGGVVNIHVVRATTKALIESNPSTTSQLSKFKMPRSWVHSLYRRIGFSCRTGTTTRPPVPKGLYDACKRDYHTDIVDKRTKYNIPPELVVNADQTPSSYVSVGRRTMDMCGSRAVPIKGLSDKRNITLTLVVTLSGSFLPFQIIYAGKTKASQPRDVKFPPGFCVTQNPNHWSNEEETLKLVREIINPYIVKKRIELKLPEEQKTLVIWDVFKGQMTPAIKRELQSLNIELVPVPANMTHFFQPLDLTVNGSAKKFIRRKFITYYSSEVKNQLDSGKNLDDIEVDFRLSKIKPLHAQWLIDMYNYFTTEKGNQIIIKGWKKAGIVDLFSEELTLSPEDPYDKIYP